MLPLRSELQQKRPPRPAFETPPVIFPPDFSVKKSKSYNSKVKTPVLAVIWLRSFCAVTHFDPKPQKKPPSKKKKLQKVRLRPKNEEGDGPQEMSHRSWRKKRRNAFFLQDASIVLASCATTSQEISSNLASKGVASQSWSTVLIFAKLFENWQ